MPQRIMLRMLKSELLAVVLRLGLMSFLLFCAFEVSVAQKDDSANPPADDASADLAVTMFPHSQTAHWWVSGQDNIISQWHPSFDAKYSGPNSFRTHTGHAVSNIATLFTGYQLTSTTEIFMHFEAAAGGGLSDALGLAGFTDLDVVRNPTLGTTPYIARITSATGLSGSKKRSCRRSPMGSICNGSSCFHLLTTQT
jgi:hypothetical protein